MRNLDYNKIMLVLGILFITLFCILTIKDYMMYDGINNTTPFYIFVTTRILELMIPGSIFIYLYNQNTFVKESQYIIKSEKLQSKVKYKIAHISDFHNTNSKRAKNEIIQKLKQNKPDIIVVTGDLVDSRRTNITTAKEFVENIIDIAPVYYVLGNHESRIINIQELEKTIKETGTIVLRNETVEITDNIQVIGLDDPAFYTTVKQQKSKEKIERRVKTKLKKLVKQNKKYKILLTHRPELFDTYVSCGVDIVFTGHAHGGQIRIPFIGGIIAPGQGFFPKLTKGIYEKDNTKMVLSSGIGNSRFPFRINNRPELIFVTLMGENNI